MERPDPFSIYCFCFTSELQIISYELHNSRAPNRVRWRQEMCSASPNRK